MARRLGGASGVVGGWGRFVVVTCVEDAGRGEDADKNGLKGACGGSRFKGLSGRAADGLCTCWRGLGVAGGLWSSSPAVPNMMFEALAGPGTHKFSAGCCVGDACLGDGVTLGA